MGASGGGKNPNVYQGWWGSIGGPKQKYIATYMLSPYEQRVCAGVMHRAVFNTFRRTMAQVPYVLPGVLWLFGSICYLEYRKEYDNSKAGRAAAGEDAH